jgi:tripartite-type tricarboxylate transporter receptor subunit TctC
MITRRHLPLTLTALALLAAVIPTPRAEDYPSKPITFVIPFPPGGGIDVILRAMGPRMTERLGKPIIIENRSGGAGTIGAASVAKAAPDGYMLLAAPSLFASNVRLFKSLPFDAVKDFEPVSLVLHTPYVLVVNPALPVHSVAELIALAKQKPGELVYASTGPGSSLHLSAELFQSMTGTKLTGVQYRGAPPALSDVIAGHVPLMFVDTGTALQQIAEGKVRALGVSSLTRVPAAPDIPTLSEAGLPGFDSVGWLLMAAPAGTPKPIIDKLHAELKLAAALPDIHKQMIDLGTIPVDSPPPAALKDFLAAEIARWGSIVEKAGVAGSQ